MTDHESTGGRRHGKGQSPDTAWRVPRIVLLAVLGFWLAALLAIATFVLALAAGWQSESVRAVIQASASRILKHELYIGRLEGSLLGRLELHDIWLRPVGETNETGLHVDQISLELALGRSLAQLRPVLSSITVERPRIQLVRDIQGKWTLQGWAGAPARSDSGRANLAPPIRIDRLELRDAELEIRIERDPDSFTALARVDVRLRDLYWQPGEPPEWPADGELHAAALRVLVGTEVLARGDMRWSMEGPRAKLESLELSGRVGTFDATGAVGFRGSPFRPKLDAAHAEVYFGDVGPGAARPNQADASGATTHLAGALEARLVWPGPRRDRPPRVALDVRLAPSKLFGQDIESASLAGDYRLAEGAWKLRQSTAQLRAGRVTLSGQGRYAILDRLELHAPDIDLSLIAADRPALGPISGRAELLVDLAGPITDPLGRVTLACSDLRMGELGPAALRVEFTAKGERRFQIETFDYEIDTDAPRLPDTYLRSTRPALLVLEAGGASIRDFELTWPGGTLVVGGGFAGEVLLPTRIDLHALDIAIAADLLGLDWPLSGTLSGNVDLEGSFDELEVRSRLDWIEPRYEALVADRIGLEFDVTTRVITVSAEVIQADREQLRLQAELPRSTLPQGVRTLLTDERTRFELRATELDLEWLTPLLRPEQLAITGVVDGALSGAGDAPFPRIHGALNLRDVRLTATGDAVGDSALVAGPLDGRVSFTGSAVSMNGLRVGEGLSEFRLSGHTSWSDRETERIEFSATLTGLGFHGSMTAAGGLRENRLLPTHIDWVGFEATELARLADLQLDLGGAVSGRLELSGLLEAPQFHLSGDWEAPRVAHTSADRLRIDVINVEDRVELTAQLEREGRTTLSADAQLPFGRDRPALELLDAARAWPTDPRAHLVLSADDFSLSWLPALGQGGRLTAGGSVNGVVRVEGADPLPSVEGDLSLLGGTFALSGQTATVGPLDGDVRLAGTQANFQRLSLASRKGRAEISGRVGWSRSGVTDVSLQIFFEHFLFNQLGLLRTYLDGNLITSGPLDALTVTGAIQMSDVRVSFPSQQDPILKEIRVLGLPDAAGSVSIYEGEGEIAGLDANTRVDVAFVIPPGTWVRGMGLDAEIIGQLRVTKQPKSPLRYLGQFEVEHGRYTLQGKRFELERGVAVFGDTEEAIPYVDIVASRQASRDVRVTAHLTGRADAPRLQLTSVPPMDSAEIVSYLFFGGARTSEGGGAGSDIGTSAASVVGAMLLDNVSPELREQLRIDQISITSEAEDEAPALEIETQITPDVYLRLIQSLGATADEAAEIRWRFYRNFNLKSRVQRSGESSIDLLWAYDFWGLDLSGLKSPPPPYQMQTAQDVGEPCQPPDECAK